MQVGLQHTDDAILEKINRRCTHADGVRALRSLAAPAPQPPHGLRGAWRLSRGAAGSRLLKECCFKVDVHLMPDLPGSSPAQDRAMLHQARPPAPLRPKSLSKLPHGPVPLEPLPEH